MSYGTIANNNYQESEVNQGVESPMIISEEDIKVLEVLFPEVQLKAPKNFAKVKQMFSPPLADTKDRKWKRIESLKNGSPEKFLTQLENSVENGAVQEVTTLLKIGVPITQKVVSTALRGTTTTLFLLFLNNHYQITPADIREILKTRTPLSYLKDLKHAGYQFSEEDKRLILATKPSKEVIKEVCPEITAPIFQMALENDHMATIQLLLDLGYRPNGENFLYIVQKDSPLALEKILQHGYQISTEDFKKAIEVRCSAQMMDSILGKYEPSKKDFRYALQSNAFKSIILKLGNHIGLKTINSEDFRLAIDVKCSPSVMGVLLTEFQPSYEDCEYVFASKVSTGVLLVMLGSSKGYEKSDRFARLWPIETMTSPIFQAILKNCSIDAIEALLNRGYVPSGNDFQYALALENEHGKANRAISLFLNAGYQVTSQDFRIAEKQSSNTLIFQLIRRGTMQIEVSHWVGFTEMYDYAYDNTYHKVQCGSYQLTKSDFQYLLKQRGSYLVDIFAEILKKGYYTKVDTEDLSFAISHNCSSSIIDCLVNTNNFTP